MKQRQQVPPRSGKLRHTAALYYALTKPGIVYSNTLTAIAGYLFASRWHVHVDVISALIGGTACLIAAACVYNNYIDRGIDANMSRTKKRALVTGEISAVSALSFGTLLGMIGLFALLHTNTLTVCIGLGAVLSYVVFYGISKRRTPYSTLIGTVPGAASLVAGYTAVTHRLDIAAGLLFLVMLTWQMTHFYAIAIRRKDEYAAAGLPVWPVRYSVRSTTMHMITYSVLFIVAVCLLTAYGYTGVLFSLSIGLLGLWWLRLIFRGLQTETVAWAKHAFLFSLVVLMAFTILLPFGPLLP